MARYVLLAAALLAGLCAVQAALKGTRVKIEKAPWLVQLKYTNENGEADHSLSCGGVIISENIVLSAAVCMPKDSVYHKNPSGHIAVNVGATYKLNDGQDYQVKAITRRLKATDPEGHFGWAIITMAEPIQFNKNVQPIALATEKVPDNTRVHAAGWGVTKMSLGELNHHEAALVTVDMHTVDADTCKNYMMKEAGLDKHVARALLCVKPNKKGMLCKGDLGSAIWAPARGEGKPAQLLGLLTQSDTCDYQTGVPLFVDLVDPAVTKFLVARGVHP